MKTRDMPIIELAGTPYERGFAHGKTLGEQINRLCVDQDKEFEIAGEGGADGKRSLKKEFLAAANFDEAINACAHELLDEIRGIADGAELPFESVLSLSLGDEIWCFTSRNAAVAAGAKCTAFGLSGGAGAPTWSGQNMDVGLRLEGHQVLFRIVRGPGEPVSYVFSTAGSIGLTGMNSALISICCNALLTLSSRMSGLPVAFIVRRYLEHDNFAEAAAFIKSIPHASGQNYLVAGPGKVHSYECSSGAVVEYAPAKPQRGICHTNHPLVTTDIGPVQQATPSLLSSHARLASVNARLDGSARPVFLEDLKAALAARDNADFPVSRKGDYRDARIGYTLGSLIYEIDAKPKLHIAAGPPCETEWLEIDVKNTALP